MLIGRDVDWKGRCCWKEIGRDVNWKGWIWMGIGRDVDAGRGLEGLERTSIGRDG